MDISEIVNTLKQIYVPAWVDIVLEEEGVIDGCARLIKGIPNVHKTDKGILRARLSKALFFIELEPVRKQMWYNKMAGITWEEYELIQQTISKNVANREQS